MMSPRAPFLIMPGVTDPHCPSCSAETGMSVTGNLYNPQALAMTLPKDKPVVFVIGAMAAGHVTVDNHPYVRAFFPPKDVYTSVLFVCGEGIMHRRH